MKLLDSSKTSRTVKGFTIIEIMVVMVIAGVILSIILFSVPALQRNSRNTRRDQDAAQIAAAINDCMTSNQLTLSRCNERSEIVFDDSKLTAFTGFHYGENPDGTQNPPDFGFTRLTGYSNYAVMPITPVLI